MFHYTVYYCCTAVQVVTPLALAVTSTDRLYFIMINIHRGTGYLEKELEEGKAKTIQKFQMKLLKVHEIILTGH